MFPKFEISQIPLPILEMYPEGHEDTHYPLRRNCDPKHEVQVVIEVWQVRHLGSQATQPEISFKLPGGQVS